jgi:hypothetical protein
MMKTKIIALSVTILALLYISSCEKEIVTTAFQIDSLQTATFQLYLKGEFDASMPGMEFIEDGKRVVVSVSYASLNPNFAGSGRWKSEATTSNGMISVEVPATDNWVTVYVKIDDFVYDYVVDENTTERRFYMFDTFYNGITVGTKNIFVGQLSYAVLDVITN